MVNRANGTRENGHRANGNRANVVAPISGVHEKGTHAPPLPVPTTSVLTCLMFIQPFNIRSRDIQNLLVQHQYRELGSAPGT